MSAPFEAMVMAGGRGTRLLPHSAVVPKPMLRLGDSPLLEIILRQLHSHGLRRICISVNHLRSQIQTSFSDGASLDLSISYVTEDHPLGTCGALGLVIDRMAEEFILINGDVVTDLDLSQMLTRHRARRADATVAVLSQAVQIEFGTVELDQAGGVLEVREKPLARYLAIMGIYCFRREAIRSLLRPGEPLDTPQLLAALIALGARVEAFVADCRWMDIGTPDHLARAKELFAQIPLTAHDPP
jgi:NDP-sugar pyrophosphorylase family protein